MNLKTATLIALAGCWAALIVDIVKLGYWVTAFGVRMASVDWMQIALQVLSLLAGNVPLLLFFTVLYRKQQAGS